MKDAIACAAWILSLPFACASRIVRLREHIAFLRLAAAIQILCECNAPISLVGFWRCSCSFTYRGHLLQICPLCGRIPRIVRCYECGITLKLPEPYHAEAH